MRNGAATLFNHRHLINVIYSQTLTIDMKMLSIPGIMGKFSFEFSFSSILKGKICLNVTYNKFMKILFLDFNYQLSSIISFISSL